jgi:hypothetical protein
MAFLNMPVSSFFFLLSMPARLYTIPRNKRNSLSVPLSAARARNVVFLSNNKRHIFPVRAYFLMSKKNIRTSLYKAASFFIKTRGGQHMERVHYRRVSNRGRYASRPGEGGGFREKLITQAIVSGLVLAFTLTVCVFENPFSASMQSGLQRVFEGPVTADALMADMRRLSEGWLQPLEEVTGETPIQGDILQELTHSLTVTEGESKSPVPELSVYPEP